MREFSTPAAFRAAVESRLRDRARTLGVSAYVLRRQAALERLMVRLDRVAPGRWALKGGLALETRLGAHARVSVDLDADHAVGADAARADLQCATVVEAGDHFDFALTGSQGLVDAGVRLAVRYALESSLAGRSFEPVQADRVTWRSRFARRPHASPWFRSSTTPRGSSRHGSTRCSAPSRGEPCDTGLRAPRLETQSDGRTAHRRRETANDGEGLNAFGSTRPFAAFRLAHASRIFAFVASLTTRPARRSSFLALAPVTRTLLR